MTTEELITEATQQFSKFLKKHFNGKRIRINTTISVATLGNEIKFTEASPALISPPVYRNRKHITKESHLEILSEEKFESIRDPAIRTVGKEIIHLIKTSELKTVTATEIITLFRKNSIPLYGKHKLGFHTELARVNHILLSKYDCRILRFNEGEFSTSPDRHFALFTKTVQKLIPVE
jgi:hypothetical protein